MKDPDRLAAARVRAWKVRAVRHYDVRAPGYERLVSWGPLAALRRRERDAVLGLADLAGPARATVIDVGCGGGFYARAAKRAGKWVHAIDAAPGMVQRVRPGVDLAEVADLETFAPGRRYDVVVCCGVLEFVADRAGALDRLCALCAPRARLVLQVPRAGAWSAPYRLEKWLAGLPVALYTRDELVAGAARRGFALAGEAYPLPYNMVIAFDAPAR